ncbi:lycopene cyclase domain-containing protein [Candidatus Omnitrophota bacterium]
MKEYTILSLVSIFAVFALDRRSKVNILKRGEFYILLCAMFVIKLFINGYLTGKHIVMYNQPFYLGIRVGSIPLEDFMFGFSMITMTIIFWEYFKSK